MRLITLYGVKMKKKNEAIDWLNEKRNKPMKSVLISISPKWCELIASGKKTIIKQKRKTKNEILPD